MVEHGAAPQPDWPPSVLDASKRVVMFTMHEMHEVYLHEMHAPIYSPDMEHHET